MAILAEETIYDLDTSAVPSDTGIRVRFPKTCIAGMGPAGFLSAYYLSLAGHNVILLDKRTGESRNQRIVITHHVLLVLLENTDLFKRGIQIPVDSPIVTPKLEGVKNLRQGLLDDDFFLMLIKENFVIELKVLQKYLEDKLIEAIKRRAEDSKAKIYPAELFDAVPNGWKLGFCNYFIS